MSKKATEPATRRARCQRKMSVNLDLFLRLVALASWKTRASRAGGNIELKSSRVALRFFECQRVIASRPIVTSHRSTAMKRHITESSHSSPWQLPTKARTKSNSSSSEEPSDQLDHSRTGPTDRPHPGPWTDMLSDLSVVLDHIREPQGKLRSKALAMIKMTQCHEAKRTF